MAKKTVMNDVDSTAPDEIGHFRHHFSITMELDKHPMLSAMALIAVGLIIYYVFKHGTTAAGLTSTSGTTTSTTTTGGQPYVTQLQNPLPVTVTNPPTTTIGNAKIRASGSNSLFSNWDSNHSGVPYYTDTNSTLANTTIIPFGTAITVLGSGIPGANNGNSGTYSQIRWSGGTGYVATQDVAY